MKEQSATTKTNIFKDSSEKNNDSKDLYQFYICHHHSKNKFISKNLLQDKKATKRVKSV